MNALGVKYALYYNVIEITSFICLISKCQDKLGDRLPD